MINYKGTPLLGEDSNPQHTSEFFAIAGTVLFWLIFTIFSFAIKPQPKKPEYKEVQIVLSSTPVVQKTEEAPAPAEAASASAASSESVVEQAVETPVVETPAPKAEPTPVVKETPAAPKVVEKKTETPKAQTTPKTQPKKEAPKTETQKQDVKPETYGQTIEELMAKQFNSKSASKPKKSFEEIFKEDEVPAQTNQGPQKIVTTQNTIDGSAGEFSKEASDKIKSSNGQKSNKNENITHGSELDKIRNTEGAGLGDNQSNIGKSPTPSSGNNIDAVTWADAAGARTQYNFDTELSTAAKRSMLITKPIQFKITFSVDSNGNVIVSTINIKNEVMLTDIINNEMRQKISSWKFSFGKEISKAEFIWTLAPSN